MKKSGLGLVFIAVACIISGCTSQKRINWQAIGGSRGDGSVKLAIQHPDNVEPILDTSSEQQAIKEATRKCVGWGYTGAEPFGGAVKTCSNLIPNGLFPVCLNWVTTKEYQCTTKKESNL